MKSKMKWTVVPLTVLLLQSCAWRDLPSADAANRSALYDPPAVTMIDGTIYRFQEGYLTGAGQKWHSDYSYRRAVIIGAK